MRPAGGPEDVTPWADVEIALGLIAEARACQRSAVALALVPHRDMRGDAALDDSAEHLACAVGDIGRDLVGLETEALLRPPDHGLGGIDFPGDPCRRRLDVDDDCFFGVDQIVEAAANHDLVARACRPRGAGI